MTVLSWALAAYAVTTLVAMAPMSIGVGVFLITLLCVCGGPRAFSVAIRETAGKPPVRTYLKWTAALALFGVLSLIVARFFPVSYNGRVPEVSVFRDAAKLWYLFLPIPLAVALEKIGATGRRSVFWAWIWAFGLLSIVGIIQYFTGWPRPQDIPSLPGRFHATLGLGHHLSVASVFIFPFFAALDAMADSLASRNRMRTVFLAAILALGSTTLFFTYSRTLWGVLPVGIVGWLLLKLPRRQALLAVLVLAVGIGWGLSREAVYQRLFGTNIGISTRQDLWHANWDFFKARPLTGIGFRHNEEMSGPYLQQKYQAADVFAGHAHNNFLEALGGTGAPGAIAWAGWSLIVLLLCWRERKQRGTFAAGLFFAWIVFQLNGLTQVNFWEGKVQHQMAFVTGWLLFWAMRTKSERNDA